MTIGAGLYHSWSTDVLKKQPETIRLFALIRIMQSSRVSSGNRADYGPGAGDANGAVLLSQAGGCVRGSGQICWRSLPEYGDRRRPIQSAGAKCGSGGA